MKERPILFSGAMVRALLAGTKTQTRRVMRDQPCELLDFNRGALSIRVRGSVYQAFSPKFPPVRCPYGLPGDRLWVRETWAKPDMRSAGFPPYVYAAEWPDADRPKHRWRPSIHMPRAASRITLEVTGVRVERLQDISEADAAAEGIQEVVDAGVNHDGTPRDAYRALWASINGPGSWDANPWVWVVEFKRLEARHG